MIKPKRVTLTRTNTTTGATLTAAGIDMRGAAQRVAWCAVDNVGLTPKAASACANALTIGTPLTVGVYSFVVVPA